ncbi:MAG: lasso RiPP family leader peptide-containing protein [bacterium]|nr:lasso RiPP family leader peptide-containing protein [bacterium]
MKRKYVTPEIVVHGTVEKLTQGQGIWGSDDFFTFSIGKLTISGSYGTNPITTGS